MVKRDRYIHNAKVAIKLLEKVELQGNSRCCYYLINDKDYDTVIEHLKAIIILAETN